MKKLSLIEIAFFLKRLKIFNDLDLDLLIAIAEKANQDIYDSNEKVFSISQRPMRIYLIAKGSVAIYGPEKKLIASLKEEDFFGDESLFNERARSYHAVCESKTLFITLSKTNLLNIISECPTVAIAILNLYAKKIHCRHEQPAAASQHEN